MPPHHPKPPLSIEPTTLFDYPSQHYGSTVQGDPNFAGATPSYVIWNMLQRYTRPGSVVLDPCCGSGTTLDVCRDLDRKGIGFDLAPARDDVQQADARQLPLEDASVDFVFIDPPYSTHLNYSDDPRCLGKLHPKTGYYDAMEQVFREIDRVLKPDRHMALYVSDSYEHGRGPGKGFHPIGFELFRRLRRPFIPVDIVAVVRRNKTLEMGNYRKAAEEENFFLRGFNYLFIMKKPKPRRDAPPARDAARKPRGKAAGPRTGSRDANRTGKTLPPTRQKSFTGQRPKDAPNRRKGPKPKRR